MQDYLSLRFDGKTYMFDQLKQCALPRRVLPQFQFWPWTWTASRNHIWLWRGQICDLVDWQACSKTQFPIWWREDRGRWRGRWKDNVWPGCFLLSTRPPAILKNFVKASKGPAPDLDKCWLSGRASKIDLQSDQCKHSLQKAKFVEPLSLSHTILFCLPILYYVLTFFCWISLSVYLHGLPGIRASASIQSSPSSISTGHSWQLVASWSSIGTAALEAGKQIGVKLDEAVSVRGRSNSKRARPYCLSWLPAQLLCQSDLKFMLGCSEPKLGNLATGWVPKNCLRVHKHSCEVRTCWFETRTP